MTPTHTHTKTKFLVPSVRSFVCFHSPHFYIHITVIQISNMNTAKTLILINEMNKNEFFDQTVASCLAKYKPMTTRSWTWLCFRHTLLWLKSANYLLSFNTNFKSPKKKLDILYIHHHHHHHSDHVSLTDNKSWIWAKIFYHIQSQSMNEWMKDSTPIIGCLFWLSSHLIPFHFIRFNHLFFSSVCPMSIVFNSIFFYWLDLCVYAGKSGHSYVICYKHTHTHTWLNKPRCIYWLIHS